MSQHLTQERFRDVLARFATGVTVVATTVDGEPHGMTANAFTSVSLEPLLVLVCVERRSWLHGLLAASGAYAATMLGDDQEHVSVHFSSADRLPGRRQFTGLAWKPAPITGCPVLTDGLAYVDCRVQAAFDGGDHAIYLGQVVDLRLLRPRGEPLVYFGHRYRRLAADGSGNG